MLSQIHRRYRSWIGAGRLLAVLLASPAAWAETIQKQGFPEPDKLLKELFVLLLVVTLMESAMTTIFQWRLYRLLFNARAVKTIVMVLVGWSIVRLFNYDAFARILAVSGLGPAVQGEQTLAFVSSNYSAFLSALVMAGGTSGINTLFRSFGFRAQSDTEPALDPPREDEAWVSVTVRPVRAVGPIEVLFKEKPFDPADPQRAVVGVTDGRSLLRRVYETLIAVPGRIPNYGGRKVKTDKLYEISVRGRRRAAGANATTFEEFEQPVYSGAFASRAIVDLVVTV